MQQADFPPAANQFSQGAQAAVRMIGRARHTKTPESGLQDVVRELAAKLPPMLPKVAPVIGVDRRGLVDGLVFQKARDAEQETFRGRSMFTEQFKLGALSQQQKRNFVKLVSESHCKGLEQRFIGAVRDRSAMELISLAPHPDLGGRFDEIIDCPTGELPQRSATPTRMRDGGIDR